MTDAPLDMIRTLTAKADEAITRTDEIADLIARQPEMSTELVMALCDMREWRTALASVKPYADALAAMLALGESIGEKRGIRIGREQAAAEAEAAESWPPLTVVRAS